MRVTRKAVTVVTWGTTAAIVCNLFLNFRWWHPICMSGAEAAGPYGYAIGFPLPFAQPTGVVFGSVGRNSLFGPGLFSLNASLFRHIKITERIDAELRGEAFQLTNTPQFSNPQGSLTSSTFGYVTGTLGSGSGVNGVSGGRAFSTRCETNALTRQWTSPLWFT